MNEDTIYIIVYILCALAFVWHEYIKPKYFPKMKDHTKEFWKDIKI